MIDSYESEVYHFKDIVKLCKPLSVLYVEDDKTVQTQTLKMLNNFFENIDCCENGEEGLARYKELFKTSGKYYDIVITDLKMPVINGVDMSEHILNINKNQHIIVITAYTDIDQMHRLINMGISSFIKKPLDYKEVTKGVTKVLNLIEEKDNLHNQLIKSIKENEKLLQENSKLKKQVNTDPLTNLYNRRYFTDISKKIMELCKRDKNYLGVLVIDIDKFKPINDTYGHAFGDEVIIRCAKLLEKMTRKSDICARIGGEEFAILLPETDKNGVELLGEKIRKTIEDSSLEIENKNFYFTVSIGGDIVDFNNDTAIENSIKRADDALYRAKRAGRNKVIIN